MTYDSLKFGKTEHPYSIIVTRIDGFLVLQLLQVKDSENHPVSTTLFSASVNNLIVHESIDQCTVEQQVLVQKWVDDYKQYYSIHKRYPGLACINIAGLADTFEIAIDYGQLEDFVCQI